MSYYDESMRRHIQESVISHHFADSMDWALGLDELSCLDDDDIDALVTNPANRNK